MLSTIITIVNWRIVNHLMQQEASLSSIARATNTTKANTHHALRKLTQYDLVRKKILGKTHFYHFNILHPQAIILLQFREQERQKTYNKKLNNLPVLVHNFFQHALQNKYKGSIFFGSSIDSGFHDIDVFIVLKKREEIPIIRMKLREIDKRISPLFGIEKEIMKGLNSQDMLYKNIVHGISYGIDIIQIKNSEQIKRKKDIQERFIIAYREILSCLEFTDKTYQERHFDRGIMDFMYALLNYFDYDPKNDREAIILFKEKLNENKPKTIKQALYIIHKYAWIL